MPGFPYADHPPEDDEMPEDWRFCPQHDIYHSPDGWCGYCREDAARDAKANGESFPYVTGKVASAWRPAR